MAVAPPPLRTTRVGLGTYAIVLSGELDLAVSDRPTVTKLLTITGVSRIFRIEKTLTEAMSHAVHAA